jgi:hypothetical protein
MARKMCTDCNTRRATPESPEGRLCAPCLHYAGWENEHSDYGHDEDATETGTSDDAHGKRVDDCPVCHPELDPRNAPARTGHRNTAPHSWNSHAACEHFRTPAARAACRKAGGPTPQA